MSQGHALVFVNPARAFRVFWWVSPLSRGWEVAEEEVVVVEGEGGSVLWHKCTHMCLYLRSRRRRR